ncbi:MAG: MFS transporter [Sphingomonadales bacterium]|nr:MFS transporter [Sphingomonadales bacterium]
MSVANHQNLFRWAVVALLFLCILFIEMSYSCLPPLFSQISQDIPLSKVQMGMIYGVVSLAAAGFALIGGVLSDIIGSRRAIGGALLTVAVFGGMRTFADSVTELTALTFIVGLALALIPPNVAKVLSVRFPQSELGRAYGIVLTAVPIGVGLGIATGASVLAPNFGGWRGVMEFVAFNCLMMGVFWLLVFQEKKLASDEQGKLRMIAENIKAVFPIKDLWRIAVFSCCFFFAMGSLMSLLPIVLEERGIARSGELASLIMWASVLGSPLGGVASDKIGKRKPFLIIPAIVMGLCIPLFLLLTGISLTLLLLIAGFASGMILPIMLTTLIGLERIGVSHIATAVGLVMMVGNTVGFTGPIISGALIDLSGSPWPSFLLTSTILFIAAAVISTFPHQVRQSVETLNN